MTDDDHYPAPEVEITMVPPSIEIVELDGQVVLALREGRTDIAYISEWFLEMWLYKLREVKSNKELVSTLKRVG